VSSNSKRTRAKARARPDANARSLGRGGRIAFGRLRAEYGLTIATFARLLAVSPATAVAWEQGRSQPIAAARARLNKLRQVLKGLARVMRKEYIPRWLQNPNDACKEARASTPLDLLARGDYASIEQTIYFLEAGEPF
jgi:DNA-binding transcriptional regulator YiaG